MDLFPFTYICLFTISLTRSQPDFTIPNVSYKKQELAYHSLAHGFTPVFLVGTMLLIFLCSVLCCIIFFVLRFVFPMLLVSISRVSILDCTFGFLCVYQPSNWFYFFFMILPCIRLRYSNHCKHILAFIALLRAL